MVAQGTDGYIHVCTICGKRLQIPERFYGKTVRCTGCRTEFEAHAPEGPTAGPEAGSSVETEGASQKIPAPSPSASGSPPPVPTSGGSYSHVCTACGAVMQVHSRYFGRELRCTSCRTGFVATPPAASAAPESRAVSEMAVIDRKRSPLPGDRRRSRWIIAGIVVVAIIGVSLWWLGGDRSAGPGSELFSVNKGRTELGTLQRDELATVTVALDRETVRELIEALEADDKAALQTLNSSSQTTEVAAGTRVRVLERRKRADEARVRIIDGPWASRIVWVPIDWVK